MNLFDSLSWQATVLQWNDWQASWPIPRLLLFVFVGGLLMVSLVSYLWRPKQKRSRGVVLGLLRAGSLLVILLMIGGLSRLQFAEEQPELVVLVDNSLSMAAPEESLPLDEFLDASAGTVSTKSRWQTLQEVLTSDPSRLPRLSERYRLRGVFLKTPQKGSDTNEDAAPGTDGGDTATRHMLDDAELESVRTLLPTAESSPIGDALQQNILLQRGRATAGIVVLSDGIVNVGTELDEAARLAEDERIPLITVGFGSDAPPIDLSIDEVVADASALLGDTVEVRAIVRSAGTEGKSVEVQLVDQQTKEVYDRQTLPDTTDERFDALRFSFLADEEKRYELAVVAEPVEGERELENNRRLLTIDVRDEPLRVLLIQDQPSYEFRFLKHLLERTTAMSTRTSNAGNKLIELTTVLQSGDPAYADQDRSAVRLPPVGMERLTAIDVVILSDADMRLLGSVFLEQLATAVREHGLGLVIIAGSEHLPGELAGSELAPLLPIAADGVTVPRLPVTEGARMRLTELGRQTPALRLAENGETELPVIYGFWRPAVLRPAARVLIEAVPEGESASERSPLLVTQLVGAGQVWVQLTDQSYRLEPFDGTGSLYRRYWLQILRRLARGKRQSQQSGTSLEVEGERFPEGVNIPVRVRVSGAGGQVTINVRGEGREQDVVLPVGGSDVYRGTIPALPAGDYRAVLVDPAEAAEPPADRFTVQRTPREWSRLRSDLDTLRQIAVQTGGTFLRSEEAVTRLEEVLPAAEPVRRRPLPPEPLWNHPLLVALSMGLLCGEWILRRHWGYS